MIPPACIFALLFIVGKASCASVPYEMNYNPVVLGHEDYVRPIHYLASAYARRHSVGRFESAAVQEITYCWHLVQALCVFYVQAFVLNTNKTNLPYWKINRKTASDSSLFPETFFYFAPYLFPHLHAPLLSTLVAFPPGIPNVQDVETLERLIGPPPAVLPFPASPNFHPEHLLNTTGWPFPAFVKMCISEVKLVRNLNLPVEHAVQALQLFFPKSRPYLIYAHPGSVFHWLKEPFEHFTSDALLQMYPTYEPESPYKGILLAAYPQEYALRLEGSTEKAVIGLALRFSDDCPDISTAVYDHIYEKVVLPRGPVSYSDAIRRYTRMQIKIEPMTLEEIATIESTGDDQWRCRIL